MYLAMHFIELPKLLSCCVGSRLARALGVCRGGLDDRGHLRTFSGVARGSRWLRGSPGLIISGFVWRPSMMSSSRLEETSFGATILVAGGTLLVAPR